MSDLGIVMICLTMIVITAILSTAWYNINKVDPEEESRQRMLAAEDRFIEAMNREGRDKAASRPKFTPRPSIEYSEEPEPELELESEPDSMAPLPVDPDNPPKPIVYNRRPNSTAPIPRCTCHGQLLKAGQEVLWWPVPGSDAVKVFCQRENS